MDKKMESSKRSQRVKKRRRTRKRTRKQKRTARTTLQRKPRGTTLMVRRSRRCRLVLEKRILFNVAKASDNFETPLKRCSRRCTSTRLRMALAVLTVMMPAATILSPPPWAAPVTRFSGYHNMLLNTSGGEACIVRPVFAGAMGASVGTLRLQTWRGAHMFTPSCWRNNG